MKFALRDLMLIIQHDGQLTVEHKQDPLAPIDNKTYGYQLTEMLIIVKMKMTYVLSHDPCQDSSY